MRIPKSFKLMGHMIRVIYEPRLDGTYGTTGEARYTSDTIALQPNTDTFKRPEENREHVFLHELTHHILNRMQEHELCGNEKFVDVFSGLLHQALSTAEYEYEKREDIPETLPAGLDKQISDASNKVQTTLYKKYLEAASCGVDGPIPPDKMYREPLTLRIINGDLLDQITDNVCQEEIEAKDLGRLYGGIVSCALDKVNARIREALGWDKRDTGYKGGRG